MEKKPTSLPRATGSLTMSCGKRICAANPATVFWIPTKLNKRQEKDKLFSEFKIRCPECLLLNIVPSSTSHMNEKGNANIPDINSRIALGALHAGLGYTQVKKMLKICGVHAPTSKTFKRPEREVGRVVEKVAKASCMKAAMVERELTVTNSDTLSELL